MLTQPFQWGNKEIGYRPLKDIPLKDIVEDSNRGLGFFGCLVACFGCCTTPPRGALGPIMNLPVGEAMALSGHSLHKPLFVTACSGAATSSALGSQSAGNWLAKVNIPAGEPAGVTENFLLVLILCSKLSKIRSTVAIKTCVDADWRECNWSNWR